MLIIHKLISGPQSNYHSCKSLLTIYSINLIHRRQKLFNTIYLKFIELQAFRQWILSNDGNSVRACFDGQEVDVPLNLFKLIKN